jgi:O-antigen ligase
MAAGDFWSWMVAIGSFILVATVIDRADRVRWIIVAFVSGAVLSVCLGLGSQLASGGLTGDAFSEGRLRGGGADPNYFAAGLVPALVLSAWLAGSTRRAEHRLMAVVAGLLLLIGLLSTQSRGGVVGLTAVVLASLVLGRGRRATIFAGLVTLVVAGAVYFTASPQSWHRVSNFGGDGTGRLDVWRVAWRVSGDYPFTGVGVGNFRLYSPKYVRRPGNINRVDIIVDRNVVVHNSYLSVLVETGIPGLILFLTVIGACLAAHWRAIRAFEQRNEWRLGGMGRALLVATIGLLAASFFISNGPDKRLWILLALGPVMLTIARRSHGGSVSRPGEQDEGATAAPLAPRPTRQTTAA